MHHLAFNPAGEGGVLGSWGRGAEGVGEGGGGTGRLSVEEAMAAC